MNLQVLVLLHRAAPGPRGCGTAQNPPWSLSSVLHSHGSSGPGGQRGVAARDNVGIAEVLAGSGVTAGTIPGSLLHPKGPSQQRLRGQGGIG